MAEGATLLGLSKTGGVVQRLQLHFRGSPQLQFHAARKIRLRWLSRQVDFFHHRGQSANIGSISAHFRETVA